MTDLRLFWLGTPLIELDGSPIHLETRKATSLLSYCCWSPQALSREVLANLFWPEYDQKHAQANLRRCLYGLNRSLGGEILVSSGSAIEINPKAAIWSDVGTFHRQLEAAQSHPHLSLEGCAECLAGLEQAASLYRGEFLSGLNLPDCPEFDEWQRFQRDSLQQELARTLESFAIACAARSEWDLAIAHARRWVSLDRLNEPAQRMLICLYQQSGQNSLAQRHYEEFARLLKEQLGHSPAPETTQCLQRAPVSVSVNGPADIKIAPQLAPSAAAAPLMKTKMYIPSTRQKRVSRDRLLRMLDEGMTRELTLVSAPAGFGKTSLLAEWAARSEFPIAWVSIDAADNDPTRFFTYVSEAVDSIFPGTGESALEMLRSSSQLPLATVLTTLLNDLCGIAEPFALVLDDYQQITAQPVHAAVEFILDHLLPAMHLVIASRTDPPSPLPRLRSRNQLAEVRASHLRFTNEETREFLQQVMDLAIPLESIQALDERTEGWITGLQMAALSLQNTADIHKFTQDFSGTHRYIMDFLVEEVIARQPAQIQAFLLQTSLLDRLCGPLCDAVIKDEGSRMRDEEKTLISQPSSFVVI